MNKKLKSLLWILPFILLFVYVQFIETNMLEVTHYKINDEQLSGMKVVFASDFHFRPHQEKRVQKVVNKINAQNADIILSVGDFVADMEPNETMPIEDIAKAFKQIHTKYGFYTVLGNHDSWHGREHIEKILKDNNIHVLGNENISLKINDKTVYLAGIEDMKTGNVDLNKAFNGVQKPVIFLSHTPDIFPFVPEIVNLTLAGHTHGGQIRIPFYGAIKTGSAHGNKYARGFIQEENRKLIVTTGIRTSIEQCRFNCKPEIVVIEFE